MSQDSRSNGVSVSAINADPQQALSTFQTEVIDPIRVNIGRQVYDYAHYLARPTNERENDEADVVDQQFARNVLLWLGFEPGDWNYNRPQKGVKANRPDYLVRGSLGTAFLWENKNSATEWDIKHLQQMRRYSIGTAGYAVWCNMRRILAIRFLSSDTLKYEMLADVSVVELFGAQPPLDEFREAQATNLALFRLLFGKARFTQFAALSQNIQTDADSFAQSALTLDTPPAVQQFIADSRQSLHHLRLAVLTQIREALWHRDRTGQEEEELRREWGEAQSELLGVVHHNQALVAAALEKLRPGECTSLMIRNIESVLARSQGTPRLSISLRSHFEKWMKRAENVNLSIQSKRIATMNLTRIADAYQVWSSRQTDQEDIKPEIFAEQVAYVFFVRLLLVRVLEDKGLLSPRIASNGGYKDWADYVGRHFQELSGVGILSENFASLLTRKASHYYLHFFEQPVFDWFTPDDFLFVETLEFLCRYTFRNVSNDIIGFTYEEYIDRTARNRKGHFLTRPDVVEFMLDVMDYRGPGILGRSILDPACGSGSFLVHAARRYRSALLESLCAAQGKTEEALLAEPGQRVELAARFVEDLTQLFHGMELVPFACYLAEMNLLIQALDDLLILQQAGGRDSIDRFQIINTNSLDLPRDVLEEDRPETGAETVVRLSDRLADEAYPLKAKVEDYQQGFHYVLFNPPYVASKREELEELVERLRHTDFFQAALSGDTNLYLLFIRLGLYYLADYGRMVCIVPLTIFGDKSASAARGLLRAPPYTPMAAVRFYRGDILFPGVDQAVGIVGADRSRTDGKMLVAGGNNPQEAATVQFRADIPNVIEAVPQNGIWNGAWLITNEQVSLDIWQQAKRVSGDLSTSLGFLLDETFDIKQGDVNATHLNPLRVGASQGSFDSGDIAVYKGEDVSPLSTLPASPSAWARPLPQDKKEGVTATTITVSQTLTLLKSISGKERGMLLRQVARLNTRERLIATWFERDTASPIVFTNELWRCRLKSDASEHTGKALLALINSKITAYLLNLFSTNNHVNREELARIPIPDPQTFPANALATLAQKALWEREKLENETIRRFGAKLPEFEEGTVYLPPSNVLKTTSLPTLRIGDMILRQEVRNRGAANGRIKALRNRNAIASMVDETLLYAAAFATVLALFLDEPGRQDETWTEAQRWRLPEPIASPSWLQIYNAHAQEAQEAWNRFVALQRQIDELIADWYGFDTAMRAAIARGLPWARRRQPEGRPEEESPV